MAIESLFIATDRLSSGSFSVLASDAMALGYYVSWDRDIPGGPGWWTKILDSVERAEAFLYGLTRSSITYAPCEDQLTYAETLGKPILPVLLDDDLSDLDIPPRLGNLQRINYQDGTSGSMARLFSVLRGLSMGPSPPTPPSRPDCPAEFALDLYSVVGSPGPLSREKQYAALDQLGRLVDSGFSNIELGTLISRLYDRRPDMAIGAAHQLDELKAALDATSTPMPTWPRDTPERAPLGLGDPPVLSLFVSYSRSEHESVEQLVADIRLLGFTVWKDTELPGGKAWWDQVLFKVRESDAFVFAAGPVSLTSKACEAELDYAQRLGKPIVRFDIGASEAAANDERFARVVSARHVPGHKTSVAALAQALQSLSRVELPELLPYSPDVPATYLFDLQKELKSKDELTPEAQRKLFDQIKHYSNEDIPHAKLDQLLRLFEGHDIMVRYQDEIAALRERLNIPSETSLGDKAKAEAEAAAKREAAQREAEAAAKREAAQREAEAAAKREAAQREAEAAARREAAQREAEAAARREAEAAAQREVEAAAQREVEAAARREAEAAAQREVEAAARREAEAAAQREVEAAAQREAEVAARRDAEAAARREAEVAARREAEVAAQREAEVAARREAEVAAQREAEVAAKTARPRSPPSVRSRPPRVCRATT